jgi:hypothetical protein
LSQKLQDVLRDLGLNTDKAGESSVLRVLISYAASLHSATLKGLANADDSYHPAEPGSSPQRYR